MLTISEMVGKTFQKVTQQDNYSDELVFENENEKFIFYHDQDCCESVNIEDITGDLSDLENTPILVAEERSGEVKNTDDDYSDVDQWTFYEFRTSKGSVTVRWYGTSNGYYSTSVDLRKEVK